MTIKEVLKKIEDTGYDLKGSGCFESNKEELCTDIYLDPLFWQALGKGMGWKQRHSGPHWMGGTGGGDNYIDIHYHNEINMVDEWVYHWHCFIDHLAEGKSIKDYFKSL